MGKLANLFKQVNRLEKERKILITNHERELKALDINIHTTKSMLEQENIGLNTDTIALAESVIKISGSASRPVVGSRGHGKSCRKDAINDAILKLAENPAALTSSYIGVKNYDGFGDQRSDHSIGMCPRHGGIVFSISRLVRDRDLTDEEVEASIYYLKNIEAIQATKETKPS